MVLRDNVFHLSTTGFSAMSLRFVSLMESFTEPRSGAKIIFLLFCIFSLTISIALLLFDELITPCFPNMKCFLMRRMKHHKLEEIKLFAEKKTVLLIELFLLFGAADSMLYKFKEQTKTVLLLTFFIRICRAILLFVFILIYPVRIKVLKSTRSKKLDGDGEE